MKYGALNPCKDCTQRRVGCHGACERYEEYRSHIDSCREERNRQEIVDDYCIGTYKKIANSLRKKERGRKKDGG